MTQLMQDVRYALRQLRKASGFTLTSILVPGLGIGTTTGMIAVVQGVLLKPLRYPHAERLTLVGISATANQSAQIDYPRYEDMQRSLSSFDGMAGFTSMPVPARRAASTDPVKALRTE